MPDAAPPTVSEGTVRPAPQGVTREQVDAVLADFRTWLEQLADATSADAVVTPASNLESIGKAPLPSAERGEISERLAAAAAPPDLHTLLAQFMTLRHEIRLQTKTSRAQQEQSAEALQQLNVA